QDDIPGSSGAEPVRDLWPPGEDRLKIGHDGTSLQVLVRELVPVTSQTPITTCRSVAAAASQNPRVRGREAVSERLFVLEPGYKTGPARHVVVENDRRDSGRVPRVCDRGIEVGRRHVQALGRAFEQRVRQRMSKPCMVAVGVGSTTKE